MSDSYLDLNGLNHYHYQAKLEGIRGIYTLAEFNALSAEEKSKGTYFVDNGQGEAMLRAVPVTLSKDGWVDGYQTVIVKDILAEEDKQLIIPIPSSQSESVYKSSRIKCVSQEDGHLTFSAATNPSQDVSVIVYIFISMMDTSGTYDWWSPNMTSNNTPLPYVVTASHEYRSSQGYGTFYGYFAFDGERDQTDTQAHSWYSSASTNWIQFDFGVPNSIVGVRLYPDYTSSTMTSGFPTGFTLSGSNDGQQYKDLYVSDYKDSYDINAHEWCECLLNSAATYRYFKFTFENGYGLSGQVVVGEIEFLRLEV